MITPIPSQNNHGKLLIGANHLAEKLYSVIHRGSTLCQIIMPWECLLSNEDMKAEKKKMKQEEFKICAQGYLDSEMVFWTEALVNS